jgi:hypothetical protein
MLGGASASVNARRGYSQEFWRQIASIFKESDRGLVAAIRDVLCESIIVAHFNRIQVSLKKEIHKLFGGQFEYIIKAGEQVSSAESLSNDRAGQLILALYLDEPYNAHQKYRIFGTDYERVFGREINAAKIYLAYVLYNAIQSAADKIEDPRVRAYQLTKFVLLGVLGGVLRRDPSGAKILDSPEPYLLKDRAAFEQAVIAVAAQIVTDFNYYVKERQGSSYYDYKSEFKSPEKYRSLSPELQKQFERALLRHPEDSFDSILASKLKEAQT